MPTPLPGLTLVPRWRTMISPPVTVWPANTFTPRRLALESRPLREEPRPFLCAMSPSPADLGEHDPRQLLAVAGATLVAALGLELEHAQLRPAQVLHDLGRDVRPAQRVALEHGVAVAREQQRLELDGGADVFGQPLDEQGLALLDAVLLTAGLDDCVGHFWAHSVTSDVFARERRRPPLRPRRRGREDSASSSSSDSSPSVSGASGSGSSSAALRRRGRPGGLAFASSAAVSSTAFFARERRRGLGFSSASSAAAGAVPASAGASSVRAAVASATVALRFAGPFLAAAERRARLGAFVLAPRGALLGRGRAARPLRGLLASRRAVASGVGGRVGIGADQHR